MTLLHVSFMFLLAVCIGNGAAFGVALNHESSLQGPLITEEYEAQMTKLYTGIRSRLQALEDTNYRVLLLKLRQQNWPQHSIDRVYEATAYGRTTDFLEKSEGLTDWEIFELYTPTVKNVRTIETLEKINGLITRDFTCKICSMYYLYVAQHVHDGNLKRRTIEAHRRLLTLPLLPYLCQFSFEIPGLGNRVSLCKLNDLQKSWNPDQSPRRFPEGQDDYWKRFSAHDFYQLQEDVVGLERLDMWEVEKAVKYLLPDNWEDLPRVDISAATLEEASRVTKVTSSALFDVRKRCIYERKPTPQAAYLLIETELAKTEAMDYRSLFSTLSLQPWAKFAANQSKEETGDRSAVHSNPERQSYPSKKQKMEEDLIRLHYMCCGKDHPDPENSPMFRQMLEVREIMFERLKICSTPFVPERGQRVQIPMIHMPDAGLIDLSSIQELPPNWSANSSQRNFSSPSTWESWTTQDVDTLCNDMHMLNSINYPEILKAVKNLLPANGCETVSTGAAATVTTT